MSKSPSLNPLTVTLLKHSKFVAEFAKLIRFYGEGGRFVGLTFWFPDVDQNFCEWNPRRDPGAKAFLNVTFDGSSVVVNFENLESADIKLIVQSSGSWVSYDNAPSAKAIAGDLDGETATLVSDKAELVALLTIDILMCRGGLTSEQCEYFWLHSFFAYQDSFSWPY